MKIKTTDLRHLQCEIEGKIERDKSSNEMVKTIDGILRADNLSQKNKFDLRMKSKEIQELLKIAGEQEKDIREKYVEKSGDSFKLKDGMNIEDFNKELIELYNSEHEISPIHNLNKETILGITNTSDFYELLIELQSS